jgi:hypothetical protein
VRSENILELSAVIVIKAKDTKTETADSRSINTCALPPLDHLLRILGWSQCQHRQRERVSPPLIFWIGLPYKPACACNVIVISMVRACTIISLYFPIKLTRVIKALSSSYIYIYPFLFLTQFYVRLYFFLGSICFGIKCTFLLENVFHPWK